MGQETITHTPDETRELGRQFARTLAPGTIVALEGELGAGKSTFLQGVLAELGVEPPYPSPTFVIMHQYDLPVGSPVFAVGGRRVYHVDAYRVDAEALCALGWEEWMTDPAGVVFIEWPERVAELILETARWIRFSHTSEGYRRVEWD